MADNDTRGPVVAGDDDEAKVAPEQDQPDDRTDPMAEFAKAMSGEANAVDLDGLYDILESQFTRSTDSQVAPASSDDDVDLALALDATNVQQAQDFSIVLENIDLTKIGFLPQIDIDDSGSV
jgi:hypothetical protein